nr:MAG TPA: hypothetical protein [Caudoviricetes sp.]
MKRRVKSDPTRPHKLPPHPCAKCQRCTIPSMTGCGAWLSWYRKVWPIVTGRRARNGRIP